MPSRRGDQIAPAAFVLIAVIATIAAIVVSSLTSNGTSDRLSLRDEILGYIHDQSPEPGFELVPGYLPAGTSRIPRLLDDPVGIQFPITSEDLPTDQRAFVDVSHAGSPGIAAESDTTYEFKTIAGRAVSINRVTSSPAYPMIWFTTEVEGAGLSVSVSFHAVDSDDRQARATLTEAMDIEALHIFESILEGAPIEEVQPVDDGFRRSVANAVAGLDLEFEPVLPSYRPKGLGIAIDAHSEGTDLNITIPGEEFVMVGDIRLQPLLEITESADSLSDDQNASVIYIDGTEAELATAAQVSYLPFVEVSGRIGETFVSVLMKWRPEDSEAGVFLTHSMGIETFRVYESMLGHAR